MWKKAALNAYYWSTLRSRQRAAEDRAWRQCEPIQIVFYHRVADGKQNDWTISTRGFARQINWLRERFDIVSLDEAQLRIASGCNRRRTVCITFDDGYADNRRFAVPLLLKYRIPFTYFVSTNHVLGGIPFPHDVAAGRPLPVNTLDHLREMAAAGVEIGAHSRSHANLGGPISREQLADEIVGSKEQLEAALGRPVRYFAFPYGLHANMTDEGFRIAYRAGFAGVCSAYGGYNFPGQDAFHLRRFHADREHIRFKNWLTLDPRKLRSQTDFDPGNYRSAAETIATVPPTSPNELTRSSFTTSAERGTVPLCLVDSEKSGQSPSVLKLLLLKWHRSRSQTGG